MDNREMMFIMGATLLIVAFIFLTGCATAQDAGEAMYEYQRFEADGSKTIIRLKNNKNVGEVSATAEAPGGWAITLTEKGVDAAGPMAIQAESNKIMAETLKEIIPQALPLLPASPR